MTDSCQTVCVREPFKFPTVRIIVAPEAARRRDNGMAAKEKGWNNSWQNSAHLKLWN